MKKTTLTLILASSSPRRRSLLERLHLPFEVRAADIDERPRSGEDPSEAARRIASDKARVISATTTEGVVLAADTIVVLDGRILGKPGDEAEARRMLRALRSRAHEVITGIAVSNGNNGRTYNSAVVTKVWMRDYSNAEIDAYVTSGDPMDKAGAYAIQNRSMHPVMRIEGCYYNVVGLPLCEVIEGLIAVGFPTGRLPLEKICLHDAVFGEAGI